MAYTKYTDQMKSKILNMKLKGYTYTDIAKEMNLGRESVKNFCHRYRLTDKQKVEQKAEEQKPAFPVDIKLDGQVIGTIKPMPAPVESVSVFTKSETKFVQTKTLDDYSPRELIKNLYDRGYRIDGTDWTLYCLVKKTIVLSEIIGA